MIHSTSTIVESDRMPQAHQKINSQKTIQQMLNAPAQESPHAPQKQFEYPICQEVVVGKPWGYILGVNIKPSKMKPFHSYLSVICCQETLCADIISVNSPWNTF